VIVLPWAALLLLVLHFQLVRKHGISTPRGRAPIPGEPFFPNHMLKQLIVALLCIGVVVSLAALRPRPFSGPADGFSPPETLQVLWFPLAVSRAATHYLGGLGLVLLLVVFASMALVPLAFRAHERSLLRRTVRTVIAVVLVLVLTTLWILGQRLTDPLYGPEGIAVEVQPTEPGSGDGADGPGEGVVAEPHEGGTDEGGER
jgi:quinol-cytochrome oxidoreductase complex cytochrome b subunit